MTLHPDLPSSGSDELFSSDRQLTVVIVGASGGVGSALVKLFLSYEQVSQVYGLSRREVLIKDSRYESLEIDYSDEHSIELAVKEIQQLVDIVIVATGILHSDQLKPEKAFQQITPQAMMENMLVNAIGPSLVAKHLLPVMQSDRKTVFAALSARVGSISDNRLGGWYAYRASKAALNMMIKTYSVELSRRQPKTIIAGLHPGTVNTSLSKPFQRNVKPNKLFTPEYAAQRLIKVIGELNIEDSGYCYAWDGTRIPE